VWFEETFKGTTSISMETPKVNSYYFIAKMAFAKKEIRKIDRIILFREDN